MTDAEILEECRHLAKMGFDEEQVNKLVALRLRYLDGRLRG